MKRAISILLSAILIIGALISGGVSSSASELDSAYNNDISNLKYITSIKNQGEYGNCWAFAAIACCEAEAVKNHGASITNTDLSEYHLAYFSYNGERSSGDVITSLEPYYNFGGFSHLPIFTLSNWIGLVDEDIAKYSDFSANPSASLDPSLMYGNNEYYLTNAYTYSLPDEIDEVKQAILTYGAVQTSYCSSDVFLNEGTNRNKIYAHYCPTAYASDHAVAIVGWDDNYSNDNFSSSARPQNNGAWLVKNSWGDDWGLSGYFWLSYEDKSATEAIAFDVTPAKDAYDNNYYHDGGLSTSYVQYAKSSVANIFTAKGNEELSAIGVTTYNTKNASYSLEIYVNPTSLTPSGFNQGAPVHTQSGTITEAGFTTIELTSPITLTKDDTFIILIETNAALSIDSDQNVPTTGSPMAISDASVLANQTYFSADGGAFIDASNTAHVSTPFNARIKAFTNNTVLGEIELKTLPSVSSIKYGQALEEASLSGGEAVDALTQRAIDGKWSFKDPSAIVKNGDTVKIIFTPSSVGYESLEAEIEASVIADKPIISITTNKSSYRDGETIRVVAGVKNAYSSTLLDIPTIRLYYQVNDGEKIYFTDSFTFPTDPGDIKLVICAETDAVDGKYESAQKTRTFTVSAPTTDQNNDGAQSESSTQSNNNTNGGSTIQPDNNTQNDNISSEDSSSDTKMEIFNGQDMTITLDELEDNFHVVHEEPKFDGCFSSASISALTVACAIFGAALLKKKKDN